MKVPMPNLFNYATSELAQDAFILWLLEWANPSLKECDKELNKAAQKFVHLLIGDDQLEIESVKCYKQEHHIDVFAIVNEKIALIIEDKTETSEHDEQIKRYAEWVNGKDSNLELHCIYYKSGNESAKRLIKLRKHYKDVLLNLQEASSFKIITRKHVLDCLSKSSTRNNVFQDYIEHLQKIENSTNSFTEKPMKNWGYRAWQGFYMSLEEKLGEGDWKKVNNPSGGFLAFYWNWVKIQSDESITLYLQFEQSKLCVKAYCDGKSRPDKKWVKKIKTYAKSDGIVLDKPRRLNIGKTTTLAFMEPKNLFSENALTDSDMDELLETIKRLGICIKGIASNL